MEQTTASDRWDNSTLDFEIPTRTMHQVGATTIATLGFFANTVILIGVFKAKLYRQNVILLIINLVVNNTVVCATCLPYIATMAFTYYGEIDLALCKFMSYITYSITASELLGLNLVATNRYFLIVRYSTYLEIYSKKKNILIMIAVSWIVYPTIMLFPATNVWGSLTFDRYRFFCHPFKANDSFGKFFVGFALLTTVPLVIFGYVSILPKVFKTKRQVNLSRSRSMTTKTTTDKSRKRDVRLVSLVIVLLTTFCLMYLPFAVMSIIDPRTSLYNPKIHIGLLYIAWAHCLVNPVLYAGMNPQIRKAIKDLFLVPGGKNDALSRITTINQSKTDLSSNNVGI